MSGELWVEFIDERHVVAPHDSLTFGRRAELVVDADNPYLHRNAGSFIWFDGGWWLRNDGTSIELVIHSEGDRRVHLAPGAADPLVGPRGVVRFQAGIARYELAFELDGAPVPEPAAVDRSPGATETSPFGVVRLNAEQRLLLAALAEGRLRDEAGGASVSLPANAEVAHDLGWSLRKLDRKLDYLCRRLADQGVPGLRGQKGHEALDRRQRLVEHVVAVGMIDERDVAALIVHRGTVGELPAG
ncbi:MAG: hypothetical protein ACRBI6_00950 [Acidimicrobiales bacterium]